MYVSVNIYIDIHTIYICIIHKLYIYSSMIHKLYDYVWELQIMLFNCIVDNWVLDVNVDLRQAGTWDLCFSAAQLAGGHTSPWGTKLKKKKKKLYGFKSNCTHVSFKVNSVQKMQRDQNPQLPFLKGLEEKQGVRSKSRANPCTQHHIRGGQTTQDSP